MFGTNSVLNLPFPVAAKTGTTNDFRDNWTLGYTPDLVAGVWVGNADYTPMVNTTGLSGAAPIWSQFMQTAVPYESGGNPTPFNRPAGIVDKVICTMSGTEPSNGAKAASATKYLPRTNRPCPPARTCAARSPGYMDGAGSLTRLAAISPIKRSSSMSAIRGRANGSTPKTAATGWTTTIFPILRFTRPTVNATTTIRIPPFSSMSMKAMSSASPRLPSRAPPMQPAISNHGGLNSAWGTTPAIGPSSRRATSRSTMRLLFNWDLSNLPNQTITLHLYVTGANGYAERFVHFSLALPTHNPAPSNRSHPFPIADGYARPNHPDRYIPRTDGYSRPDG